MSAGPLLHLGRDTKLLGKSSTPCLRDQKSGSRSRTSRLHAQVGKAEQVSKDNISLVGMKTRYAWPPPGLGLYGHWTGRQDAHAVTD